jgi:hypothetical protein
MNGATNEPEAALEALLIDALRSEAAAAYPEQDRSGEHAWRRIAGRRRVTVLRSRALWATTVAAAILTVAAAGSAVPRHQDAVVQTQSGATAPSLEGDPDAAPTAPAPTSTEAVGVVAPETGESPPATTGAPAPTAGEGAGPVVSPAVPAPTGSSGSDGLATLAVPTAICASNAYTDLQPAVAPLGSDVTASIAGPAAPGSVPTVLRTALGLQSGTVIRGDVTGDGVDDAFVVVKCAYGARMADMYWARAVLVDGAVVTPVAGPALAASGAPLEEDNVPTADGSGNESTGRHSLYESLVGLRIDHGEVVASWVQTANVVIPRVNQWSRRVETRHRLQGGSFVATGPARVQPWARDARGSLQPFGPTAW